MGSSSSGGNVANEQLCAALGAARSVEATLGALGDGWDCLMVATRAAEPTSVSRKGVRAAHDEVDPAIAGVLDAVSSLCSRAVSCLDNLAASLPPGHFPCNDVWVALSRMLQTQTLVDPECTVPPSAITSALWTLLRRVDSATIAPTSEEFMRFAVLLQTDGGVDRETRLHSAGIFVVLACRLGDAAKGASDAAAATASSVDATAAIVLKALASIDVLAAAVSGEASLPPSPSTMLVVSEVVMGSFAAAVADGGGSVGSSSSNVSPPNVGELSWSVRRGGCDQGRRHGSTRMACRDHVQVACSGAGASFGALRAGSYTLDK